MTDLEFIKKFNKITIKDLCNENRISKSNLYTGKTSKKNQSIIKKAIWCEIAKLLIDDYKDTVNDVDQ